MKFDDFIDALLAAGWRGALDAQHHGIKLLWESLFPVIAQLESELKEAME